jgi:hypothetical protein
LTGILRAAVEAGGGQAMNGLHRLLLAACAALATRAAPADGGAGAMVGYVFDPAGSPIRGVKIEATHKPPQTLAKKAYTDDEGFFRMPDLPPGLYDVTASARKLKTAVQRDVVVTANGTVELSLILEVASAAVEEVRVVVSAPKIATTTPTLKEIYDLDFVQRLPHQSREHVFRSFESVATVAPGATVDGFSGASAPEVDLGQVGWRNNPSFNREAYAHVTDNPFLGSRENPLSTFSIDVDTASYANVRRFLRSGSQPPVDAVRIEEMVNYFPYGYPPPTGDELIGYENRMLRKEDFNDDRKDAGELGAGETVTALYEIIPPSARSHGDLSDVDPLRYQRPAESVTSPELLTVKARYKLPDAWFSKKRTWAVTDTGAHLAEASADFRFAAAVAAFGMILRDSPHKGTADHDLVLRLAGDALADDPHGYRREFLELVRQARALQAPALHAEHAPPPRR